MWQERNRGALHQHVDHARYDTFQMLVVAMVHSHLDYVNAVPAGLPAYLHRHLQCLPTYTVVFS